MDEATARPNETFFPRFDGITGSEFRGAAHGLVDVHVESTNGTLYFTESNRYSISMTPAIGIVLAVLLDTEATLSWNWEGFEALVTLGEWKHLVSNQNESVARNASIVTMQSPIPPNGKEIIRDFLVPLIGLSTVVRNGPKAPYADVIAPSRLIQTKFTMDRESTCYLDFRKEIDKMGLTSATNYTTQQAVTSVLYRMCVRLIKTPCPVLFNPAGIQSPFPSGDHQKNSVCFCSHETTFSQSKSYF